MARMRIIKNQIKLILNREDYAVQLDEIKNMGMAAIAPLISFLPSPDPVRSRAAAALGHTVAAIAAQSTEEARVIMRRLMWHMNEDSGNIGWGIPESFAEILARSEILADEFHRILLSYIIDTGKADNYCEHALLRRSCYEAVAILAGSRPDLAQKAVPALIGGLDDEDLVCRGYAAHALSFLRPGPGAMKGLRALAENGSDIPCPIFDGRNMLETTAADLAVKALEICEQSE